MLWMWLACLSPTACPDVCEKVADECSLGAGYDSCLTACRDIQVLEYERRDFSHCVALADCGDLATGECQSGASRCGGPVYIHVALSAGCGAPAGAMHGVVRDSDCGLQPEGDWGDLGAPQVGDGLELVFDGGCEVQPNFYASCELDGQICNVATEGVI